MCDSYLIVGQIGGLRSEKDKRCYQDSGDRWRALFQDPKYALLADILMGTAGKHARAVVLDNQMA